MADMLGLLVMLFPGAIIFLILCNGGYESSHLEPYLYIFRVQPYISLSLVRDHIEEQLGSEVVPEDYVFLRSVGRCMAVVSFYNLDR